MSLIDGFSVVIPHFNASQSIKKTLNSVLNQSQQAIEIIVVDDYSSDEEVKKLKALSLKLKFKLILNSENRGPAFCRNIGINTAISKYIAFLDSDDEWHPEKLSLIYPIILSNPFIIHDYTEEINFKPIINAKLKMRDLQLRDFLIRNHAQTSCVAISKEIVKIKFDESMRYCEDYDFCLRYLKSHKKTITFIEDCAMTILGRPQLTKGGLSGNRFRMRAGEYKAYKKLVEGHTFAPLLKPIIMIWCTAKHFCSWLNLSRGRF